MSQKNINNNIIIEKISLILFIILFLIIIYIEYSIDIVSTNDFLVSNKSELKDKVEQHVYIKGEIINYNLKNKTFFGKIKFGKIKNDTINIVIFNVDNMIIDKNIFQINKNYIFIGKVKIYKNDYELIVDEIRNLNI